MQHPKENAMLILITALLMMPAEEATVQQRLFRVSVNGKPAGSYTQVITTKSLTTEVKSSSTVDAKVFVVKYHYSFDGMEEWIGRGKVLQLYQATVNLNDGGSWIKSTVKPSMGNLLMESTTGKKQATRESWTATFWCLPPEEIRDKPLTLLNFEYGKPEQITLIKVGDESVNGINCSHWRVMGLAVVDLWYDSDERLVKRSMIRKGQTTTIDLVSIQ